MKTRWFTRFARKEGINEALLCEAGAPRRCRQHRRRSRRGLIEQRVARPGQGRRGGYRTVIAYQSGTRAVFVFGFAKSERDNISEDDLEDLQAAARQYFRVTDADPDRAVAADKLTEVACDDETAPMRDRGGRS